MLRGSLTDLTAVIAFADRLSLRAAPLWFGATASAHGHSTRQLEERLGVCLQSRTTRSVSMTDAGVRLMNELGPAMDLIAGLRPRRLGGRHVQPAVKGFSGELPDGARLGAVLIMSMKARKVAGTCR
jgi:DNA-binding transcriptional LysR family regulator